MKLSISDRNEISVKICDGKVEEQIIGKTRSVSAHGIVNGKQGTFTTDGFDSSTPSLLVDQVINSAKYGKEASVEDFYRGGKRIKKVVLLDKERKGCDLRELRNAALKIYEMASKADPRIESCEVGLTYATSDGISENSYGVKYKRKWMSYTAYVSYACKEDEEPQSGGYGVGSLYSLEDLMTLVPEMIQRAIKDAVDLFKAKPVPSNKYNILLSDRCVATLLDVLLSHLNAKRVEKHLSVFENKIGEKIVSGLLTVENQPHKPFFGAAEVDSDLYPTKDFTVIENGVLKTYFHSLETARKFGVEPNGCSVGSGNGSPRIVTMKPGKLTLEAALEQIQNGVYIDSISGLNSGINDQTLDFSLPCSGYTIEGGKITKSFNMNIVSGNVLDLFNQVEGVLSEVRDDLDIHCPSLIIKSLQLSGN